MEVSTRLTALFRWWDCAAQTDDKETMFKLLFATLLCTSTLAHAGSFQFSAQFGKYPVGFRVVEQYDYARVFKTRSDPVTGQPVARGERARPIQTLIWYPAGGGGAPMAYREYFNTLGSEDDFTLSPAEKARRIKAQIDAVVNGPRAAQAGEELARPMRAIANAAPHAATFPVVIYAPGMGSSAMENADLCEYLASHGYLVIGSPSLGPRSRAMTPDLEGVEAQAGDIAFLIAYARGLPQADMARVGVIGYSWGGLANVIAAAKDDRIGALVSLDGSLRAHTEFIDGGRKAVRQVTPARLTAPLLFMAARARTLEEMNKIGIGTSFSLMNKMKHADTYIMTMNPMKHADFDAYMVRFQPDARLADYSREEVSLAYTWTARYVHRFLDAYLKSDASGTAFINNKPAVIGVPPRFISTDIRPAASRPATAETLAAELGASGFARAIVAYDAMKAREPDFTFAAAALNEWGYALLNHGKPADAVHIFKLGVYVHPASANLFDSLAEAQLTTHDRQGAIDSYRRALALNPDDPRVKAKLTSLGAR